jgi:diadenosine tetraphosphate (Ap4A) HIT family hydrolase
LVEIFDPVVMDNLSNCPFCSLPSEQIIMQNTTAYMIFDRYPVTTGHALAIPRRHVASYFDLDDEEILACNSLLRQLQATLLENDPSIEGFNLGVNIGAMAGQTIEHCHIHLIPRRAGDVKNPRGGIRHIIPGKGYY